MARKQDTECVINRNTTDMAGAVVVVLVVAVVVTIADLVTETATSEAVLQKAKREQRDQVASNSITAFVRLVPAPICSLASAPRFGLRDFSGIRTTQTGRGFEPHNERFCVFTPLALGFLSPFYPLALFTP